ncbi:MAG: hypothetical protein V4608_00630 [Bacteroidota bacterium]
MNVFNFPYKIPLRNIGILLLLISFQCFSQAPFSGINYQAIARDTAGLPMSNVTGLKVQFTIFDSIVNGNQVFSEIHPLVNTNRYGLFSIVIGQINSTAFDSINWTTGKRFLEVAIDAGGTGFFIISKTQMISVPYALYAKTSGLSLNNWSLSGNSITAGNFIGTSINSSLRFRTNNTLRMIIDSVGKVGIGTATPAAMLEVAGQVKITGGLPGPGKVLTSDASGLATWVAPGPPYILGNGLSSVGNTLNSVWTTNSSLDIHNNNNNNSGKVGIGTTTPDAELEVISTSSTLLHGIVGTEYSNNYLADSHIWLRKARGTENSPLAIQGGDEIGSVKFRGHDGTGIGFNTNDQTEIVAVAAESFSSGANGSYLRFMTTANGTSTGSERMRIDQNGYIGMGVTGAPSEQLDVGGTIKISGTTGELNRSSTGSANLIPIAYGNISSGGTINSGTGNITVVWDNVNNRYKITIAGETYTSSNYITLVTAIGNPTKVETSSSGGNLIVTIHSSPGNLEIQNAFQFITYKP